MIYTEEILVQKANGELVKYDRKKLEDSLLRAGADVSAAEEICDLIDRELVNGISTRKIYRRAFALLKKRSRRAAGRYQLKTAILKLGPSGYPFEVYITELFSLQGYKARTGQIVDGKCISHEIDVLVEKSKQSGIVECKFRNRAGDKIDSKTTLYVYARFLDVADGTAKWKAPVRKVWLATNTRFTEDSVRFANCRGMGLLSWDYPKGNSIRSLTDEFGIHPITCMTRLKKQEADALLEKDIVLCKHLVFKPEVLEEILPQSDYRRIPKIIEEAEQLMNGAAPG